jgi:hypothetical protein
LSGVVRRKFSSLCVELYSSSHSTYIKRPEACLKLFHNVLSNQGGITPRSQKACLVFWKIYVLVKRNSVADCTKCV